MTRDSAQDNLGVLSADGLSSFRALRSDTISRVEFEAVAVAGMEEERAFHLAVRSRATSGDFRADDCPGER